MFVTNIPIEIKKNHTYFDVVKPYVKKLHIIECSLFYKII